MLILALESSAKAASAALCRDEAPIAQSFQNSGLTHSRTLLPMAEDLLKNCGCTLDQVELVAVANGPGSFTGLRIGVAAAKGLAWARGLPCAGCSSLESLAWGLAHLEGRELCCVMDARRGQVYRARFLAQGEGLLRLCEDGPVSLEELAGEVSAPQVLCGDGWQLCRDFFAARGLPFTLAPPHLRYPTAWGVARCALDLARTGRLQDPASLVPNYHRLSQAERERLAHQTKEKGEDRHE